MTLFILILMQYMQYLFSPYFYSQFSQFWLQANPNSALGSFYTQFFIKKSESNQNVSFWLILKDHSKSCYYRWRNYTFTISSCESWQKGSILAITSSEIRQSASAFFEQNRLKVQSIESAFTNDFSDKGAVRVAGLFLQHFLWCVFDIKAYLLQKNSSMHTVMTEQLVRAMVFGDRSSIDQKIYHYFEITGMLHVLAVSGMHVGLLHLLLSFITSRFWPVLRFLSQVVLLVMYAIIVGFGPSIARASTMLVLALITNHVLKRQKKSWYVLASVAGGLLLFNHWYLFMAGFQLSVLATASIIGFQMYRKQFRRRTSSNDDGATASLSENTWSILFASVQTTQNYHSNSVSTTRVNQVSKKNQTPILSTVFQHVYSYVKEICILSGFIQLMLAPILWIHFKQLSWVGFISAPVLMWLVPPIFLFATVCFGLVLISSPFNHLGIYPIVGLLEILRIICSMLLEVSVHVFIFLLEVIARFFESFAFIELQQFSLTTAFIWYSCLFAALYLFARLNRKKYEYA